MVVLMIKNIVMMGFENRRRVWRPEDITKLTPNDKDFWKLPPADMLQGILANTEGRRMAEKDVLKRLLVKDRFNAAQNISVLIRESKLRRETDENENWLVLTPGSVWYRGPLKDFSKWDKTKKRSLDKE